MKKRYITCLFFLIVLLEESCKDFFSPGYEYDCYATNVVTLYKGGFPIETFNFYDTQCTTFPHENVKVKKACLTKGPLCFSKDSVLSFFYNDWDDYKYGSSNKECGLIVMHGCHLAAPILFISPEGYKLLELCDYDSVTMFFTFDSYMYTSKEREIEKFIDMGYELAK